MKASSFSTLSLAVVGALFASCAKSRPAISDNFPLPKGAIVAPLPDEPKIWTEPQSGFWLQSGEGDAPSIRLLLTDGRTYIDRPEGVALELKCDPWAGGMVFDSVAVSLGRELPPRNSGNQISLKAGAWTVSGPMRARTFGATDTFIPGSFVAADATRLAELVKAKVIEVDWGPRKAILPAPPPAMLSDFAERCSAGFDFARSAG